MTVRESQSKSASNDDTDRYLFAEGTHQALWRWLGAHFTPCGGTRFRVWAPNAKSVSVVGDFNDWHGESHPMEHSNSGVWTCTVAEASPGQRYKFSLSAGNLDELPLKADPMALAMELRPADASVIEAPSGYRWGDSEWLENRKKVAYQKSPVSIYEVHSASWRRKPNGDSLSYSELADELIPYVLEMGFSHVQFLPMSEYPFDGSWGYQPLGLFAPTSRHGSPNEYRNLVDRFHQAGIGVARLGPGSLSY